MPSRRKAASSSGGDANAIAAGEYRLPSLPRGFLPVPDPLLEPLPAPLNAWEQIAAELPRLLVAGRVPQAVDELPLLEPAALAGDRQLRRAMVLLSFVGHAWLWGRSRHDDAGHAAADGAPAAATAPGTPHIPVQLAKPWHALAQQLGRPPVLSYASYALDNWKRLDPAGPIALGNIVLWQNFLGGLDEQWFVLVHVQIENQAAPALAAIAPALHAAARGELDALAQRLEVVGQSLDDMYATLQRMPEGCDPYIYYRRVRPYIHGSKGNPALPNGIIYDGVAEYGGLPQQFRGETGAQSSIVPALDALLGITHGRDLLWHYLQEMRSYMPPEHRHFIAAAEAGPALRPVVVAHRDHAPLRQAYNHCVQRLAEFRAQHLRFAASYIHQQSQDAAGNPTAIGTGGTPFMTYLKKHCDETTAHVIT